MQIDRHLFYDVDDGFEYEADPRRSRLTWHQIDWRHSLYRDLDPETGEPVSGSEGQWRLLR